MKSMTGYGASKLDSGGLKASVVLKSWNSRYLELSIQMPASLAAVESRIREYVEARVRRGKLELGIRVHSWEAPPSIMVDSSGAKAIADALRAVAAAAGIDEQPRLSHVLSVEGVIAYERSVDADSAWAAMAPALAACVDSFDAERSREGEATERDLYAKLGILLGALDDIDALAPELESSIRQSLRARFQSVMGDAVDEARVLGEVAAYVARHTIAEEIARLRSHAEAFRSACGEDACGKKLDFILQEMNREANTIGSKSADSRVSDAVIRMKDSIENLREQARNVE